MAEPDYRLFPWLPAHLSRVPAVRSPFSRVPHRGATAHGAAFGLSVLGFVTMVGGHLRFRGRYVVNDDLMQ